MGGVFHGRFRLEFCRPVQVYRQTVDMGYVTLVGTEVWIGEGKVTYMDADFPLPGNQFYPKEDLLQIEYGPHLILDVGWYSDGDPEGAFGVQVIRDYDWDLPALRLNVREVEEMRDAVRQAVRWIGADLNAVP